MVRLTGASVSLEPHRLVTGQQAVPKVEQLFQGILKKCRDTVTQESSVDRKWQSVNNNGEAATTTTTTPLTSPSVLDLIPDVAIVSGPMKLVMPKPKDSVWDD